MKLVSALLLSASLSGIGMFLLQRSYGDLPGFLLGLVFTVVIGTLVADLFFGRD